MLEVVDEQVADVVGVERAAHPAGCVLGLGGGGAQVLLGRLGAAELGEDLRAALAAGLDQEAVAAVEQLGQDEVVVVASRTCGPVSIETQKQVPPGSWQLTATSRTFSRLAA